MKNILKFEIYRSFHGKEFKLALLIGFILVGLDIFSFKRYIDESMGSFYSCYPSAYQAWLPVEYHTPYSHVFFVIFPILAAMPFGGSYYKDKTSGYVKNICTKVSRKEYFTAKSITVFITAAFSIILPLLIDLFLVLGIYPFYRTDKIEFLTVYPGINGMFAGFYESNLILYCLLWMTFSGILGGVIALFSVITAEYVDSLFSTITLPFAVIMFSSTLINSLTHNQSWGLTFLMNPASSSEVPMFNYLVYMCGGMIVYIVFLMKIARRKDII